MQRWLTKIAIRWCIAIFVCEFCGGSEETDGVEEDEEDCGGAEPAKAEEERTVEGETEFAEVGELVAKEFLIDPPADEE